MSALCYLVKYIGKQKNVPPRVPLAPSLAVLYVALASVPREVLPAHSGSRVGYGSRLATDRRKSFDAAI